MNGQTMKKIEKDGRDRISTNEKGQTKRKDYNERDKLTRVVHQDQWELKGIFLILGCCCQAPLEELSGFYVRHPELKGSKNSGSIPDSK